MPLSKERDRERKRLARQRPPLSQRERDRNRAWWLREIAHQPWWENTDAETMAAAREAYTEELSGKVPIPSQSGIRRYQKTMERT